MSGDSVGESGRIECWGDPCGSCNPGARVVTPEIGRAEIALLLQRAFVMSRG